MSAQCNRSVCVFSVCKCGQSCGQSWVCEIMDASTTFGWTPCKLRNWCNLDVLTARDSGGAACLPAQVAAAATAAGRHEHRDRRDADGDANELHQQVARRLVDVNHHRLLQVPHEDGLDRAHHHERPLCRRHRVGTSQGTHEACASLSAHGPLRQGSTPAQTTTRPRGAATSVAGGSHLEPRGGATGVSRRARTSGTQPQHTQRCIKGRRTLAEPWDGR